MWQNYEEIRGGWKLAWGLGRKDVFDERSISTMARRLEDLVCTWSYHEYNKNEDGSTNSRT